MDTNQHISYLQECRQEMMGMRAGETHEMTDARAALFGAITMVIFAKIV